MTEEEAQVSSATNPNETMTTTDGAKLDMESQIKAAMHSRMDHFKKQADSFTFESVRRLLEKDLELETYSLDKHKRFVKQCLLQGLEELVDKTKTSATTAEKEASSTRESPKGRESMEDMKEPVAEGKENMEDSEVLGHLIGEKRAETEAGDKESIKDKVDPSEITIMRAILKRASYIRLNSEKVTMAGVRRLLEEDLKLEKKTLDPYKKFICEKLDEILKTKKASNSAAKLKNESQKKNSNSKASLEISIEETSDAPGYESDNIEKEEVNIKKKTAPKGKIQPEGARKRQRLTKEPTVLTKRQKKAVESTSEQDSDVEDCGNVCDNGHAQSSEEKPVKKKGGPTPAYGKRVEHLKSTIKTCGMSIPPSIYKRIKQAPENKREACLIKELGEILSREGLSANPSEKEIKEVRKKKERARELEGIDMSNIVSSSRRRPTTSFVAPPKPKIPDESDCAGGEDAEDTDNEDEDDDDDDEEVDDKDDDNDDDGSADSQSEESNEDEGSD